MSQMEKEGFGEEFSICSAVLFGGNSGGLLLTISLFDFSNQTFYRSPLCFAFLNLAPRNNFSDSTSKFHLCKIMFLCAELGRKKFFHLFYSRIFRRNLGFSERTILSDGPSTIAFFSTILNNSAQRNPRAVLTGSGIFPNSPSDHALFPMIVSSFFFSKIRILSGK